MNLKTKTIAKNRIALCLIIAVSLLAIIVIFSACSKSNNLPTVTGDKFPNEIAENATINEKYKKDAEDMSKFAIDTFLNDIVKIPRVSGHEEKIRDYIVNFGQKNNFETKLDNGNVCIDVPATKGMEDKPKVILQAHMDMVGTNADGNIDMTDVPINAVIDKNTGEIHSYNHETNIGADDAEGITTLMAISTNNNIKHGPLRLLFTYEEETTQNGAKNVTAPTIDSDYLINVDCGPVGVVVDSSAGLIAVNFEKQYNAVPTTSMTEIDCIMHYLLGGHSGVDIDKDIIIAKNLIADMFKELDNQNITYQFSYYKGGKAVNAILNEVKFQFLVPQDKSEQAKKIINDKFDEEKAKHSEESDAKLDISTIANSNAKALSVDDTKDMAAILSFISQGALAKNDKNDVIESCNTGIINLENGNLSIGFSYRSNMNDKFAEKEKSFVDYAKEHSIKSEVKIASGTWDAEPNNPLKTLFKDAYVEACNFNSCAKSIHGGLESAYFKKLNPNIKMIAIGADVEAEHGVTETWYTKSLPAHFASILYVLENIK